MARKAIKIREALAEINGECLFLDGYDDCIVGFVARFGGAPVVLYDTAKIIKKLMREMSRDDAEEFFDFNIIGSGMGSGTPAFMTKMRIEN